VTMRTWEGEGKTGHVLRVAARLRCKCAHRQAVAAW